MMSCAIDTKEGRYVEVTDIPAAFLHADMELDVHYLCRCTQQDLQTSMAFICTWIQHPDEDNYKKLPMVMQYLHGLHEPTLTIGGWTTHWLYILT